MASSTGDTLLALLAGAVIGVGIGILYAPDKGSKTRERLKEEGKKAEEQIKKQIDEASNKLGVKTQAAKSSFHEKLEDTLSNASYKAEDILLAMEEKLESLRKQNARLQKENALSGSGEQTDKTTS